MNLENLNKWLTDLRTTSARQGQNALSNGGAYCCLGRLCEVAIADGAWVERKEDNWGDILYDGVGDIPPVAVQEWLGEVHQRFYSDCTVLNDGRGLTFSEIALKIEETPDNLLGDLFR